MKSRFLAPCALKSNSQGSSSFYSWNHNRSFNLSYLSFGNILLNQLLSMFLDKWKMRVFNEINHFTSNFSMDLSSSNPLVPLHLSSCTLCLDMGVHSLCNFCFAQTTMPEKRNKCLNFL